ncbi:DNA methyltransferase [Faucicola mancuniensis]|uniref:DNA methyltransferase n=1 Tax=Faucicola mancuniensis TaxID=1309795 RepID=UPI0039778B9A
MQKTSTKENDIVLDPFMGCGSTLLACLATNRKGIGIEIDDNYFSVSKSRIEEYKKVGV